MTLHRLEDKQGTDHTAMRRLCGMLTLARVDGPTGVWHDVAQIWERDAHRFNALRSDDAGINATIAEVEQLLAGDPWGSAE